MKKYISVILAGVFMFACSPPDPSISSSIETLEIGETYPEHVVKINSNFANLNTDKIEDAPSDGDTYGRKDGAWAIVPSGGGGAVDSVFGRTGAVVAVGTDYASFYLALASCTSTGQIPKWDGTGWACGTDETGSGSLPPGNVVNDIMQWDGSTWAVQGFINGLIDDTATDGDTTAIWSADKVFDELALINEVPAGGTAGQVLSKASNTDHDLAWIDQTGGGGGVTSIVAGSNITIDPTSGLGDVTINANVSAVGGYVPVPSNSDTPCTEGQYAIDRANNYLYWCYATDSWDRVPSTFDQWDNPSTIYYTLGISPTPSNGRVTEPGDSSNLNCGTGGNDCDHDYEDGADVVLHSIADSGFQLDAWSGTGLTDNGDGTATVHVDQNISDVTATFVASGGGTADILNEDFEGSSGVIWTDFDTGGTINHAAAHSGTWSCPAIGSQTIDIIRGTTADPAYTITDYGSGYTKGYLSALVNTISTGDMPDFKAMTVIVIDDGDNPGLYLNIEIKIYKQSEIFVQVDYRDDANASQTLGTSSAISLNEDHEIQCSWEHVDAEDDTFECFVDGTSIGTMPAGTNFNAATDRYTYVGERRSNADTTNVHIQVDNLYIDSTSQPDSCN